MPRAGVRDVAQTVTVSDGREVSLEHVERSLLLWDELVNPREMLPPECGGDGGDPPRPR